MTHSYGKVFFYFIKFITRVYNSQKHSNTCRRILIKNLIKKKVSFIHFSWNYTMLACLRAVSHLTIRNGEGTDEYVLITCPLPKLGGVYYKHNDYLLLA